jgi:hypothetical protein
MHIIPLTKNNYLCPSGTGDTFTVSFNPLPKQYNNYFIESCKAAKEVYDLKQGKLHMLYSGGVDSEYALNVFLSLGMDITPVIINLNKNYNDFDIKYAIDFCNKKNITPLIINLDFDQFVKSGKFLEVSKICRSKLYHMAATAYVAEQLEGTVLLGDGEPYIKNDNGDWNIHIDEHDFAVWNYFVVKEIYGTIHFNRYTPEMLLSFLSDQRFVELARNQVPGKLGSNSSKFIIYNRDSNFNLKERPKYHGYEKIETSEIFQHDAFRELEIIGKDWNGVYSKNYFEFIKQYQQAYSTTN